MHTASSAKRTCSALRSASEWTATVAMPSSLHAQITRSAISPRLAMRILRNIGVRSAGRRLFLSRWADGEQRLAVFHRLAVLHEDAHHVPAHFAFDLVHQLHGFDDAEHLAHLDGIAH